MNLKGLLFIVPISTILAIVPSFYQNVKTIPSDKSSHHLKIQKTTADTATGLAGAYKLNESKITGWYQRPGHMPVLIPDSTLTETMPILITPDVDSRILIPMGSSKSRNRVTYPKKP